MSKVAYMAFGAKFENPGGGEDGALDEDKALWAREFAAEIQAVVEKYGGKFVDVERALAAHAKSEADGEFGMEDGDLIDEDLIDDL